MILLQSLLESTEVNKRVLLDMQTLILDELDPDAEVNLIRGTETKLKSNVWHNHPWVVEVTFSNGNYKIFGYYDAVDNKGKFNKRIFTEKVKRFLPGSIESQRQALWQKLKDEFGKAFKPGQMKGEGLVYPSQSLRLAHDKIKRLANKAYNDSLRSASDGDSVAHLFNPDIRAKAHDVYVSTRKAHETKLSSSDTSYGIVVVNKGESKKNGINGFAIKIRRVSPSEKPAQAPIYVATVPEAIAKLKELLQS